MLKGKESGAAVDALEGAVGDRARPAADGHGAGLHDLPDAERLQGGEQGVELARSAGRLDDDGVRHDVHDVRPEQVDDLEDPGALRGVGLDLHQQQLALDGRGVLQLDDLDDVDQLVQLLGHLLERQGVDVDDDRDARDLVVLGGTDREGVDVERPSREQAGDAREHAGLVLHEDRQGVTGHLYLSSPAQSSRSHAGLMPRAYWMSSLLTPAATIGHTIASRDTVKSMTTGWSLISSARLMVASTSAAVSQRRPAQP